MADKIDPDIQAFIAFCEDIGHSTGLRVGSEDLYMKVDEMLDDKQPEETPEQTLRCIGLTAIPESPESLL